MFFGVVVGGDESHVFTIKIRKPQKLVLQLSVIESTSLDFLQLPTACVVLVRSQQFKSVPEERQREVVGTVCSAQIRRGSNNVRGRVMVWCKTRL